MPALLALIARLGVFLARAGGYLTRLWPFLGRMGKWLDGILIAIYGWLAANVASMVTSVGVRSAVLLAWGVFLAVVWTQITGLGLMAVLSTNPFDGSSFNVFTGYVLATYILPINYMASLFMAYVTFKLTVYSAAVTMSRTIKWLFGA